MGLKDVFERRGYRYFEFETRQDAVNFLCSECSGKTVSFGGSVTLQELNLYEEMSESCRCFWHWKKDSMEDVRSAECFVSSANAVTEAGEIVNIDGNGNRVSSTIFGHKSVYFVFGENKLCADLPTALDRARNVAGPLNAKRLNRNTPCAVDGKCHDCQSAECICSAITVLRRKPSSYSGTVVLIHESLGY